MRWNIYNLERAITMKNNRFLIVRSHYFDNDWYARDHKLRYKSKVYAILHYVTIGYRRNLDPNPLFISDWYVFQSAHLGTEKPRSAISHYIEKGWLEGLDPHPLFSVNWYLNHYAEVRSAHVDPLRHYLKNGLKEDRCISNWFIPSEAMGLHPGITNAKQALELCFADRNIGYFEGRIQMKAPIDFC